MSGCRVPLEAVVMPGPWALRGACRGVATEVFFPGRGGSTEPAKAVCGGCPVLQPCREYALGLSGLKGVWGGLAEVERKRVQAEAVTPPPPRQPRRSPLYRALEELTASPGRWARVAWYPGVRTAAGMATRLRAGAVAAPAGRWEFEVLASDGGSELRARYGVVELGTRVAG